MKVELNVPESLKQITLEQYQRFMGIYDRKDIDEFFFDAEDDSDFLRS